MLNEFFYKFRKKSYALAQLSSVLESIFQNMSKGKMLVLFVQNLLGTYKNEFGSIYEDKFRIS